jgi:hypothetical protein
MLAILVPSSYSRLPVHVSRSRSCRRCALCLASPSCIHVSFHLINFSPIPFPPQLYYRLYYYVTSRRSILYRLGTFIFSPFFFPPSSYHLGGVILICGVRICNVVAISIVQYNMSGLMEHVHEAIARSCMRVKEYRGILVFVFGVASCQMGRRILSASNSHPDHLPRTFSHASTVPRALKILPSIASSRPRCMSCH